MLTLTLLILETTLFSIPAQASSATPESADEAYDWEAEMAALLAPEAEVTRVSNMPGGIRFRNACTPGEQITLTFVGDLLLHMPLQKQARHTSEGFQELWSPLIPYLKAADAAYANLEGAVSKSSAPSSYPMFNYADALLPALKESGVDVVSTANNHCLDKGSRGLNETLAATRLHGLITTGTRDSRTPEAKFHALVNVRGFRIAWIACTEMTNGIADNRSPNVLGCIKDRESILSLIRSLEADSRIDAILVFPHWGDEYQSRPAGRQKQLARDLIEAGATAVIGSHPHVVQTMERITTSGGREGFVFYSLGNFVSNQQSLPKQTAAQLFLGLTRDASGRTHINGARYLPLFMERAPRLQVQATRRVAPITHLENLLGSENRVSPEEGAKVRTNPECRFSPR